MRFVSRHRRWWMALGFALAALLVAGFAGYLWLLASVPPLDDLHGLTAAPSSIIYDRRGRPLFEMPPPHSGRHSPVPLDDVPEALRQAIVATEDASFYQNPGVDAAAIVRAVWINMRGGEVLSGGSTITQQLARQLLLSPGERYERTLARKVREAVLAWQLARRYPKNQILELYLNEIYFGNMAYGVEAAAQAYYGKAVCDLDLAESAMLAGLPQAPSYYNPLENLKAAKARQAVVLELMAKHGRITSGEARRAKDEKLYFASSPFPIRAPHFVMYVRGLLEGELGLDRLEQGGLRIRTTLDLDLQETARDQVRYRLAQLASCERQPLTCPPGGHNVRNAALVALDPLTGEILTMLGSPDYFSARIDGAVNGTTAFRQPGSSIKPITYAAAFAAGALTPATVMVDQRTAFLTKEGEPYVPLNYDLRFRGPVRLREALASSYNVVAVKVLEAVGVEAMTGLARKMGITTLDDSERLGLAVTLGGGEVRLLELASAYAALANGGRQVKPVAILRVEDADGNLLLGGQPEEKPRVLDARVAYLISDVLSDDVARIPSFGEGSVLALGRPAAVKTGTTTDFRDNWTVGYTPGLVVGVWTGNADGEPMHNISGVSGAAPIWHDFCEAALRGLPRRVFERPGGLVEVEVCALTGALPGPDCPHLVTELFIEGTEPEQVAAVPQRDRAEEVLDGIPQDAEPELGKPGTNDGDDPGPSTTVRDGRAPGHTAKIEPPAGEGTLVVRGPDPGAVYQLDPSLPHDAQRIPVSVQPVPGGSLMEVTLLVDGRPLASDQVARMSGGAEYEVLWKLEAGTHIFSAIGVDVHGRLLESEPVRVEVVE